AQFPVEARGDLDLTIQTVDMSVSSRRPDRMRQNAVPRPLEQDMQQNVFFVHIAKTAGTSLNDALARAFDQSTFHSHVEGAHDILARACRNQLRGRSCLSGHVGLPSTRWAIEAPDWCVFTVMRDPIQHIQSHLRWVKGLSEPKNRQNFQAHPEDIKDLSRALWETPLAEVERLDRIIYEDHPTGCALFDNCQVRYLRSIRRAEPATNVDKNEALANLDRIDFVGRIEDPVPVLRFIQSISDHPQSEVTLRRSNIGGYQEDIDLSSDEVLAFYKKLTHFDQIVYDAVVERSAQQATH
ncbi:MAG: hypothetical protein AAFR70_07005, partial [Pseudomonadota bacterium]